MKPIMMQFEGDGRPTRIGDFFNVEARTIRPPADDSMYDIYCFMQDWLDCPENMDVDTMIDRTIVGEEVCYVLVNKWRLRPRWLEERMVEEQNLIIGEPKWRAVEG